MLPSLPVLPGSPSWPLSPLGPANPRSPDIPGEPCSDQHSSKTPPKHSASDSLWGWYFKSTKINLKCSILTYLTKYILYSWKSNESCLPYHVYTCTIMFFSEASFSAYMYLLVVLSLLVSPTLRLDLGCPARTSRTRMQSCFLLPGTSYTEIVIADCLRLVLAHHLFQPHQYHPNTCVCVCVCVCVQEFMGILIRNVYSTCVAWRRTNYLQLTGTPSSPGRPGGPWSPTSPYQRNKSHFSSFLSPSFTPFLPPTYIRSWCSISSWFPSWTLQEYKNCEMLWAA